MVADHRNAKVDGTSDRQSADFLALRSERTLMDLLGFSGASYRKQYSDLALLDDPEAVEHYVKFGRFEGRLPEFGLSLEEGLSRLSWINVADERRVELQEQLVFCAVRNRDAINFSPTEVAMLAANGERLQPVVIFGDSHARFFTVVAPFFTRGLLPITCLCSGASARGLMNPRSKAGYGPLIRDTIGMLSSTEALIVFKFGQVDIEFVYNFRRIESGSTALDLQDFSNYLDQSIASYMNFVEQCASEYDGRVAVMSVFPPTLRDAVLREGYVNAHIGFLHSDTEIDALSEKLRTLEFPDIATRTGVHRAFNDALFKACEKRGVPFINEFDEMLDEQGTIARPFVLGHDGTDHHVSLISPRTVERIEAVAEAITKLYPD